MLRRALKAIAWVVASAATLAIATYLIAVAVNRHDREASSAATKLEALYRERLAVADKDNAFVYLMGFDVAPREDPQKMGARRIAWMQQLSSTSKSNRAQDPLGNQTDYRSSRNSRIQGFLDACQPDSPDCAAAFDTSEEVFDDWMIAEGWLLERYRMMIDRAGWGESVPLDLAAPLPPYASAMDGQRLLLLKSGVLAKKGDHDKARELLGVDMWFWRRVLESSDTLVTKMIAAAAVNRNLEWGNLIIQRLEPASVSKVVPEIWQTAFSASERSMLRCMVGEWKFSSATIRTMPVQVTEDEPSFGTKAAAVLLRPMYQPQDLINTYAEYYARIVEMWNVPFDRLAAATTDADLLARRIADDAFPPESLYNITGRLLMSMGVPEFGAYARRIADLEGVRRATLVSAALRASNVQPADVAAELAASPFHNPYDAEPFIWDQGRSAIVFQGLEIGKRGKYSIYYGSRR